MKFRLTTVGGRTLHWNVAGLCGMAWRHGFWVRCGGSHGPGFSIKRRKDHVPLFSERMGLVAVHYIGPVVVKRLPRLVDDDALRRHVREVEDAYFAEGER